MTGSQLLSQAQGETLLFIKNYIAKNGKSPTVTEMQKGLRLSSLRSVTQRLEALERKAFIRRDKFQHRNISLLENADYLSNSGLIQVPVIASAGCDAMEVYAQDEFGEFIMVDRKLLPKYTNIAAIKAIGDSMQDAGIKNGDYVIVDVTDIVSDGDRVVAVIGNMAVIKRYQKVDDVVYLQPENKDGGYSPIIVSEEDSKVFGKVLSVIPSSEWVDDIKIEYYDAYQPVTL